MRLAFPACRSRLQAPRTRRSGPSRSIMTACTSWNVVSLTTAPSRAGRASGKGAHLEGRDRFRASATPKVVTPDRGAGGAPQPGGVGEGGCSIRRVTPKGFYERPSVPTSSVMGWQIPEAQERQRHDGRAGPVAFGRGMTGHVRSALKHGPGRPGILAQSGLFQGRADCGRSGSGRGRTPRLRVCPGTGPSDHARQFCLATRGRGRRACRGRVPVPCRPWQT